MRLHRASVFIALAASKAALHCGPGNTQITATAQDGGADSGTPPAPAEDDVPLVPADKVDLLLVVDDSASMAEKAKLLSASLGTLLRRVTARAGDVHLGVISSSLGSMGGDVCGPEANRRARLSTRAPDGGTVASAAQGFLAYGGPSATGDVEAFVKDAESLVAGVGETGCGLEAQLESAYRFLVQPDPWQDVKLNDRQQATYVGLDATVLAQRKAFLRPDSLVVVLMLTDEDDSSVDPLSVGGQGWAFMAMQFPGSKTFRHDGKSTTAPRATSACAADPASPDCTSCGFALSCDPSDPACAKIKSDPECQKNDGYYGPTEDQINVRFHRMKERYGVDPQFPIARYVQGFTSAKVPKRDAEHDATGAYVGTPTCTNPRFASELPSGPSDELCDLKRGTRSRQLVVFGLISGVPERLVKGEPAWSAILGSDPDRYDDSGIDPHMIPSTSPRPGLPPPSATRGDNGTDPDHGREWDTEQDDLQYACTFALPTPRMCSPADWACDCARPESNPPLCGATLGEQVRGKAYPTVRELRLAKALGDRALVASICPTDIGQGYASTMTALADKLEPRLAR